MTVADEIQMVYDLVNNSGSCEMGFNHYGSGVFFSVCPVRHGEVF